jgi:predicted DNA-binding transcriptional regulator AlpA
MTRSIEMPEDRPAAWPRLVLSTDDLRDLGLRFSRAQLHKLVAAGKFPAPINLSRRARGWCAIEVHAWLEKKKSERAA